MPKYKIEQDKLVIKDGVVQLNEYSVKEVGELTQYHIAYRYGTQQSNTESTPESSDTIITNTAKGIVEVVSYQNNEQQYNVPVDVVLVLDTSGSMLRANSQGNSTSLPSKLTTNKSIALIVMLGVPYLLGFATKVSS